MSRPVLDLKDTLGMDAASHACRLSLRASNIAALVSQQHLGNLRFSDCFLDIPHKGISASTSLQLLHAGRNSFSSQKHHRNWQSSLLGNLYNIVA